MIFALDEDMDEEFAFWDKNHKCKLKEECGAIGGRLTFSFTPTGLGTITKVKCACGEEVDFSDYEEW